MTVVSNASPLIGIARIDKLDLLRELYGELVIPEAVWHEVVVRGAGQPGAEQIRASEWIRQEHVENRTLVQVLAQDLDVGEAESIALALELQAEILLMDERLGRQTADRLGLRYIGVVGILVQAKHKGLIDRIESLLVALRNRAGFRISDELYVRVLQDEGEV